MRAKQGGLAQPVSSLIKLALGGSAQTWDETAKQLKRDPLILMNPQGHTRNPKIQRTLVSQFCHKSDMSLGPRRPLENNLQRKVCTKVKPPDVFNTIPVALYRFLATAIPVVTNEAVEPTAHSARRGIASGGA